MASVNPPFAPGVMTTPPCTKANLDAEIISVFVPTASQPVVDTFYITSQWNKLHPDKLINGDTVDSLLR